MTPTELATFYPTVFHMTASGASERIRRFGLMPTTKLLEFLEVPEACRIALTTTRRAKAKTIAHPVHGSFEIGDNAPLSEGRLRGRLEDGLEFSDWLSMLNSRVFFWTGPERATALRQSRAYRQTSKELLVIDTLRLATAYRDRIEITPFNTGSTGRNPKPPTRGLSTFAPLLPTDYGVWRRRRGQRDRIVELVVPDSVPDIADFILDVRQL